jgi:hypothetical protein
MLPVSLYCPFLIAPSVFSNVYLSCVLCAQCCQCLCIVYSWLPLRFSLTFICPVSNVASVSIVHSWLPLLFSLTFICAVSCVPNVASLSVLFILDYPFCFLYRLSVLCLVCLMLPVFLDCWFLIAPSVFSNVYLCCVLCVQFCQCLWIFHSWLPLRFSLAFILCWFIIHQYNGVYCLVRKDHKNVFIKTKVNLLRYS